eukprot:COSAG04_NODE_8788_length_931_cov_12.350962_3_plen_64_part_01
MPTVAVLREQLKQLGLDTKGKKAELEERLAGASPRNHRSGRVSPPASHRGPSRSPSRSPPPRRR